MTLSGTLVNNSNSKPGEVQVSELTLQPREKGNLTVRYTAIGHNGKSVTHVCFASPEYPGDEFPVYLCAEVIQPAELSPLMIDFGYLAVGTTSDSKEVKMKSPDTTAAISKVVADHDVIKEIVIAEDKKSFRFTAHSDQIGSFSAQMTVEMLVDGGKDTFSQVVRCAGQFQAVVFASPPLVSLVMGDQPKKYTVGVRHISDKPIKITSLSGSEAVQCRTISDQSNREQTLELTILPKILETGQTEVQVEGKVEGGESFSLTIPVSAFSSHRTNNETDP